MIHVITLLGGDRPVMSKSIIYICIIIHLKSVQRYWVLFFELIWGGREGPMQLRFDSLSDCCTFCIIWCIITLYYIFKIKIIYINKIFNIYSIQHFDIFVH
mgnify:CR=1 FL=1